MNRRALHHEGASRQHRRTNDGEHHEGLAPSEALDQRSVDRRDEQRAASDAGDRDAERGVAPMQEPSADDCDRRHVSACDADADADAVSEIGHPQAVDGGGHQQAGADRDRADDDDWAWTEAIGEMSAGPAEHAPYEDGGGEDRGGGAGAGAELMRHRFEEGAEAVRDPIDGEERDEGDRDHQPRGGGIELRDGGAELGLGRMRARGGHQRG